MTFWNITVIRRQYIVFLVFFLGITRGLGGMGCAFGFYFFFTKLFWEFQHITFFTVPFFFIFSIP